MDVNRDDALSIVDLASPVEIDDWCEEQDARRNDEEEDKNVETEG